MSRRVVFFGLWVVSVLCTHGVAQENGGIIKILPRNPNVVLQDPATLKKTEDIDSSPRNLVSCLKFHFQSKYREENLEQFMGVHDRLLSDFAKWESLSGEERTKLENTYTTQWALLLTVSGMIDDVEIQHKIFDKFKEALLYDGRHQDSMFRAVNSLVSMPHQSRTITIPVALNSPPVVFTAYLGIYYQGKYGEENLKQSISVLDRLLSDFTKWETLSDKEKAKLENAYISLWTLLLAGGAMTDDVKIQNTVFDKFKEALLCDGRHQASMLYALDVLVHTYAWYYDPPILRTAFVKFYDEIEKDLWKLLERSENAAFINNLCGMVLHNEGYGKGFEASDWNKFVLKKAALAQQRITPETAMAIIELSHAERGHNARVAENKYGPTPDPNRGMAASIPVQHYYPEIMRLVDMEQKMQVEEGGKSIPYKRIIQRMVRNNSAEGW